MLLRPEHVKAEIAKGQDRRVACGNSLYLLVRNGKSFWELRYRDGSAIRSHGLGPASGENAVTPASRATRARGVHGRQAARHCGRSAPGQG